PLRQVIRIEFGQEVIGAYLAHHGLVEYPGQRGMQHDVQVLQARVAPDLCGQSVAVHFRHFDIRDEHQQRVADRYPGICLGLQPVERLAPVVQRSHLDVQCLETTGDLLAGHRGVVHHKYLGADTGGEGTHLGGLLRRRLLPRQHFGQDLLDIDDLDHLVVDPRYCRQVVLATGAPGRRMDVGPVEVDDALDRTHQETLHPAVVFGDDDEGGGQVFQGPAAGGLAQVNDRQGAATDMGHAAHHGVEPGQ